MSEAPAPVEAVPEQQEGGEQGSSGPGENYGECVDAFNDQCSQRPDSGGMEAPGDQSEGFEGGQVGDSSFFEGDDGGSEFSDGSDMGDFAGDQGEAGGPPSDEGFDTGSESQDASEGPPPQENGQDGPADTGESEGTDQDEGDAGSSENSDQSGEEGNDDQQGEGQNSKQESPTNNGDKTGEKDKSSQSEKGKKPPPGDNMLSRLARGEPTKEDLQKLAKDQKKQKSGSAVPKGDWLPKGGGGSKHAQAKESRKGPSKIEQYQKEAKAKAQKWDDVQAWNNNIVQRAKAQNEEIWEGVKRAGQRR